MRRFLGNRDGGWHVPCRRQLAQQVKIEPRPKPAPKQEEPGGANIRVDTTLILVPVSVNDPLNRPVSGLEKENFRLFEDKVPQTSRSSPWTTSLSRWVWSSIPAAA